MARILVIDDEEDLRSFLREVLEGAGHDVEQADNGASALARFDDGTYDLVICDVLMPEVDGIEVARTVSERFPSTKFISISGGSATLPAKWSLKMTEMFGADAVLYKPFSKGKLMELVDGLLASQD